MNETVRALQEAHDLPSDAYLLGVDAQNSLHVHSAGANTVWVFGADESVEMDIGEKTIEHWIDFVDNDRGDWQITNYDHRGGFGFVDDLVDEIAETDDIVPPEAGA